MEGALMSRHTRHRWTVAALALLVAGGAAAGKPDTITATIVDVNADAHTVTLKNDDPSLRDIPVEGDALKKFDLLEPGKTVTATFRDSPAGHHEAITRLAVFKTVQVFEAD
jgi:hypothetical protein